MATREQIVAALFAILSAAPGDGVFKTMSRRNRDPEGLDPSQTPAFFLIEHTDKWDRLGGYNLGGKREMKVFAIVYYDAGADQNIVPSSVLNPLLDAIEGAMVPDNQQTNTFTIGGLVQACLIDGESQRASGDVTGKGLAVIPIRILFP